MSAWHGQFDGKAEKDLTNFKPCERTVRMCIEALPTACGCSCNRADRAAIEALLPDPAKALVEEYRSIFGMQVNDIDKSDIKKITDFTNWLIDTGRIKGGGE